MLHIRYVANDERAFADITSDENEVSEFDFWLASTTMEERNTRLLYGTNFK